ncbi:shikimate kinase [Pontibacillus sp. ALD_SL1]|uniref:shikimate kinase n=1 Tax=Pontibacillus sp. ALD_SL1 TaxID=2777185 RepID=UPI001A95D634|nr:shikimate kinase [Pontibacillus sp. ALD_SL1]QSS98939.1 shikimate kinase [Pontibacillus sp. ALD_SL1]
MQNIYLIGFMGSGKSSVGKQLAERLQKSFIDLDQSIEERNGKSIPDIFAEGGEASFRKYEAEALSAAKSKDAVIATGGGIIETPTNHAVMESSGKIIYLHTDFDSIIERLQEDQNRPLWNQDHTKRRALFEKRLPTYKEWAHVTVNTNDRAVDEIVVQVANVIK